MRHRIFGIGVVYVICGDKLDPCLLGHFQKLLVHKRLIRQSVILELEEIVVLAEDILYSRAVFFASSYSPLTIYLCTSPARQALKAMMPP